MEDGKFENAAHMAGVPPPPDTARLDDRQVGIWEDASMALAHYRTIGAVHRWFAVLSSGGWERR